MASTKYVYSIQNDTPNHTVNSDRLTNEIRASSIVTALDYITTNGDELDIWFKDVLSSGDQTTLTGVVNTTSGEPYPQQVDNVNIASAASTAVIMSQEKGFQDLTGHNFYKKGIHITAAFGTTTDFYLKFTTNMYLSGGGFWCGSTAVSGDYVTVQIVDKDNILGYGAGLVLATFIDTDFCWPNKTWEVLTNDAKLVPPGIYLRMRYVSIGSSDVDVVGWYSLRT